MAPQNYANHRQYVPLFHFVLFGVLALTLIGSLVNLYESWGDHQRLYSAALIVVLTCCMLLMYAYCRIFPLKAQDRAIRAEEGLRHFMLTGKPLPGGLETLQIVALRFASDGELPALAERAAKDRMKPDDIKRAVRDWRADTYRV